ncbi:MAG: glycoside hydrolase/phage tail family protein [Cohaesibacter sp.]|nr:glycoside hydrolase/phage tail family protein [Cohaesibacter sp.]
MATLVLTAAATALASSTGLGAIGTALLTTAATVGGKMIDTALFSGGRDQNFEGPRLDALDVTSSTEGNAIKRAYGRVRIGGEIIWATTLEEVKTTSTQSAGGKGGGGSKATTTTYSYYANFAIGICEGPVGFLNRIWADGKELDMSAYTFRFYHGADDQIPDSLIESVEGAGNVPAYRGLSYIVFERMELSKFGNRIPQLTFEIVRPSPVRELERDIAGVNLIPGSTEFGYEPGILKKQQKSTSGEVIGETYENMHQKQGVSDWNVSLDQMKAIIPNVKSVCLVVSWFFDDLRVGECKIAPKVEIKGKNTAPYNWSVSGLTRDTAALVTQIQIDGESKPAYGGSPSDKSVIHAIQDLKARGYDVMLYPFIMGDIASDNSLIDPYGRVRQAAFPWRGRITCHPAPGQAGSPDKSAAAASQVSAFLGSCSAGHFSVAGEAISYSGPNEWSYRRFILHMASLAKAAGGVASFCIGSEMVALTQVRDGATSYPFVSGLKILAADVRSIVGAGTKLGYAADWSEYHSHRPGDGSGDVIFNMDPLWSDANIDFIGIDNYLPLSDWRRGRDHLDYDSEKGHVTPYELDYLQANIEGGEYYDWYYADSAARAAQSRTAIFDGAHGEDWIYRQKDIKNWWLNSHHDRPAGVRQSGATAWAAQSKPIWFTELGCPALDLGANQPNVFYDPKSSESALPYFSSGARDDVQQHRALQAVIDYWADGTNNPVSTVYGGFMVNPDAIHIWSWDARPFPSWPLDGNAWADAANWQYGHWLSSRVGLVYMPDLMRHISEDYGFTDHDFDQAYGACDGYVIDNTMSLRDAWSPLALAFGFDLVENAGEVRAISRKALPVLSDIDQDALLDRHGEETGELAILTRAQESELPKAVRLRFINANRAYQTSTAEAQAHFVGSSGISESQLPIVLDEARARSIADYLLSDIWAARENGSFTLMPSRLALMPGDVIKLDYGDGARDLRLTSIDDGEGRECKASAFIDAQFAISGSDYSLTNGVSNNRVTKVIGRFLDLPMLKSGHDAKAGYVALAADPWPGKALMLRSQNESGWQENVVVAGSAIIGESLTGFGVGPVGVFDHGNQLDIEIYSGSLLAVEDLDLFAGANSFAIQNSFGQWEVFQAGKIELIGTNQYRLSRLLRGQLGTESAIMDIVAAGAAIVYLAEGVAQVDMSLGDLRKSYYWRYGPSGEVIGSDSFTTQQHTFSGRGLRPFSPVHPKWKIESNGDHLISWIRRTRQDGDSWALYQVPLGEDRESYEMDILTLGGEVKRTIAVTETSAVYSQAERISDLGGETVPYKIKVYQMSALVGRGSALCANWVPD